MALMDPYGLELFPVELWGVVLGVTSTGFIIGGLLIAKFGLGKNPIKTMLLLVIVMGVIGAIFTIRDFWWLYAVGILLSGTGTDGLEGLEAMRAAGALTIAESPDTAPVPEMPEAALKSGAAQRGLRAQMIASSLVSALSEASSKTTAPPSSDAILAELENFPK